MTLTLADGPLAQTPPESANYQIEGPGHKLLFTPFPRRVRAVIGEETIVDTDGAMLLHESNILPVVYVPFADVRSDLLTRTDLSTFCPFKGEASYWSITVDGREVENAVWGYESAVDGASWLEGYVAIYWARVDHWYDEDVEVFGHIRDPYHRIDVRPTSRHITVEVNGIVVAETNSAEVLSETGFPNRYYIPASDIATAMFETSATSTHCPYKGDTEYHSLAGDSAIADVAWSYPEPFDESQRIAGHWCFLGDDVKVTVSS